MTNNDRNSYNGFSFRLFLTFVAMQIALGFPSPVAEVEACTLSNSRLDSTKILNTELILRAMQKYNDN